MKNSYSKIFMWMFIGLLVTFATGYFVSTNENMLSAIFGSNLYWLFPIAELVVVIFLSARLHKMSDTTAKISFILYSFLTGLTFSSIFVIYELTSIMYVFLVSAIVFGVFAIFGAFTKIDLTKLGTILLMILFGIIICSIINIFLANSGFDIVITIISLIVFMLFTAYDMQNIKKLENYYEDDKLAIFGALQLYLDFINIFLDLLRLFGKSND